MMTTPKSNFQWNCATPCFVSKTRHPATSIYGSDKKDERRSTGLRDADYSAAFETMGVRRCFGKAKEAQSQVDNTRRTFPTTWVYPGNKGCNGTATSPGPFTLPIAWNSDTIDSGIQRQGNRRNLSTRDNSPKKPTRREMAMFEAICRLYMSPKKTFQRPAGIRVYGAQPGFSGLSRHGIARDRQGRMHDLLESSI